MTLKSTISVRVFPLTSKLELLCSWGWWPVTHAAIEVPLSGVEQ